MKIALIGYGKMGRMLEEIAASKGHTITARFSKNSWDMHALEHADVCIEFTEPESALENIKKLAPLKKNIVIGTTGWYEHIEEVERLVRQHDIGLLYSPNFSLGVNIFCELLNQASKLFHEFPEYDAAGIEYHHNQKKDSPSGLAVKLTEMIENNMPGLEKLDFSSVRCGSIFGIHSILFDSPFDTITLTHTAKNREGFARGALQAAEWLLGRKGLFTFSDCLKGRTI